MPRLLPLLLLLGIGCAGAPTSPAPEPDPLRQSAEDAGPVRDQPARLRATWAKILQVIQ